MLSADTLVRAYGQNDTQIILGAIEESKACGVVVAQKAGSDLLISHLYVLPGMRRQGIAGAMLRKLLEIADMNDNLQRVSCTFLPECDDLGDDGLARLFIGIGFSVTYTDDREYLIDVSKIAKSMFWSDAKKTGVQHTQDIISFSAVSRGALRDYANYITSAGIAGAPLAFPEGALPELSMAYWSENRIQGVAIVEQDTSGALRLSWLHVEKQIPPTVLPHLLRVVFSKIFAESPEANVYITTINEISQRLVEKLCPDSKFRLLAQADFDLAGMRDMENVNAVCEYLSKRAKEL
jgi:predicted GNAT family acetyltransferase